MLREAGCRQKLGFFLHIPFPVREIFATLPMHDRLARALMAYDLIGFQTESDVQRFRDYVLREAGGSADGDRLSAYGRTVVAQAFPTGIDAGQFAEMAARRATSEEAQVGKEVGRTGCTRGWRYSITKNKK